MANTSVTSGNVQPGGTVSSGDTLFILNGGVATQTVVLAGGQEVVSSGGTASGGTISSGGDEIVYAGGEDLYGDVRAGGKLDFFAGGIGSHTIIENGGTLVLDQVTAASGTVITAGPRTALSAISGIQLSSGAVVDYDNVTVASGATARVTSGGIVSGATLLSGGQLDLTSHGSAAAVTDGGQVYDNGGTVSGATVLSGGELEVVSATLDLGTGLFVAQSSPISKVSVSNGGTFMVDHALSAALAVPAGAEVVVSGGATYRLYQATIFNVAVIDGDVSATVTSGGLTLLSGAAVKTVSAVVEGSGTLTISSGGTDSASTAETGGKITVSAGGVATGAHALYEGEIIVLSGGLATGLFVNGSNTSDSTSLNAAILVSSGGSAAGDIHQGSAIVAAGADIGGLFIDARSTLLLESAVIGAGQVVQEGAVTSARTVTGATISSGGILTVVSADVQSGGTLVLAGSLTNQVTIDAGGLVSGAGVIVNSANAPSQSSTVAGRLIGGTIETALVVQAGGVLSGATGGVYAPSVFGAQVAGAITVQSGGLVSGLSLLSATVFGGVASPHSVGETDATLSVQSGGHASSVVLNGGNATALSGAVVSGLTATKGRFTLSGTASGVVIGTNGQEAVSPGAVDTGAKISSGGVQTVFASGTASATTISDGGTQTVSSGGTASGAIVVSGGLQFVASGGNAVGTDITAGGAIDIDQLAYAVGGTSAYDPVFDTITITEGGVSYTQQLSGSYLGDTFNLAQAGDGSTLLTASPACYCRGTLILTGRGDVPVETLAIGDTVITASGPARPIRWIGRRSYAGRFLAANPGVQPILFRAGSLGGGLPRRDLHVSPKHAMLLDGVLVPADGLVNGTTIVQERALERVDYFHVELDQHDVLLAEGAPSESFVDDDSRGMFHNAAEWGAMYPGRQRLPAVYCAARVEGGYGLEVIRRRLTAVAREEARVRAVG